MEGAELIRPQLCLRLRIAKKLCPLELREHEKYSLHMPPREGNNQPWGDLNH